MSNFDSVRMNKQNGKVVYNAGIVNGSSLWRSKRSRAQTLVSGKKRGTSLFLEKDGIYADVSVIVKYGYNVPELPTAIQAVGKTERGNDDEISGRKGGRSYSGRRISRPRACLGRRYGGRKRSGRLRFGRSLTRKIPSVQAGIFGIYGEKI